MAVGAASAGQPFAGATLSVGMILSPGGGIAGSGPVPAESGSFVSNGYTGKIDANYGNPLASRNAWSGTPGEPHGIENMFLTSFRYYLP